MSTIRTRTTAERKARSQRKAERAATRQAQAALGGIGNPAKQVALVHLTGILDEPPLPHCGSESSVTSPCFAHITCPDCCKLFPPSKDGGRGTGPEPPPRDRGSSGRQCRVTTARAAGTAAEKQPDLLSPTLIAWVRKGPCAFCEKPIGCDPHHTPPRGALGRTIDLLVSSACRPCHDLCDRSPSHGGYSKAQQSTAVATTLTRFLRLAPCSTVATVLREFLESIAGDTT